MEVQRIRARATAGQADLLEEMQRVELAEASGGLQAADAEAPAPFSAG